MSSQITVSDVTRKLREEFGVDVPPRSISDLFYSRELDDRQCPVVGGRRLIPTSYLPTIVQVVRKRGWLTPGKEVPDQ